MMDQAAPSAVETTQSTPLPQQAEGPHPPMDQSKRSTRLRIILSFVLIMISLSVAAAVFSALISLKQAPPRDAPVPRVLRVEVFSVGASDLRHFLSGFGTARADRETIVSAEVAGRITEAVDLHVGREVHGARVISGSDGKSQRLPADVLVEIDPQMYEERLEQAAAAVSQDAIAIELLKEEHATNQKLIEQQLRRMETIQREFKRREALLAQGAGAETDLERARLELEQYRETQIRLEKEIQLYPIRQQELQARMNSHRSELKLAELDLEKATVRAPFSGQLSQVFVEEGQYVRPGDNIAQVTNLDLIEVPIPLSLAAVAEVERLLKTGETVRVELARSEEDFLRENAQVWHGHLTRIAPQADERTRTVLTFVEVHNDQQEVPLRPGAFVYARILAELIPASRGVLVPRDAIVDGKVYVVAPVAEDEATDDDRQIPPFRALPRDVVIDEIYQSFALVSDGLEPDEQIVMTNLDILKPDHRLDVHRTLTLDDEFARLRVPYLEPVPASR